MTENPEEKHLEDPGNIDPGNVPGEVMPAQDKDTTPQTQETENMEVHKHPHHVSHKKKWGEYLLEFLMIFFAVSLGFLAENLREHIVDNEKREQYIRSLTEDLAADTTIINDIIQLDEGKMDGLSSMYECYDTVIRDLKATSCMGILIKYSKVNRPFQVNDRTLTQLANAGGYRLLKKEDADSILVYQRAFKSYHDFESTVYQEAQDNVRNTLNDLADFKIMFPLQIVSPINGGDVGSSTLKGPLLFSQDRTLLNKWFNQLQLYYRVTKAQMSLLTRLKAQAERLIIFYKNKYHLE